MGFPHLAADAQNPALYSALLAAIHLMLFAMVVRLYSARTTRDYLFLAMLAFSAMLASAILTVDTMFLFFFLVFLALAVSTFIGLEMRRSSEGAVGAAVRAAFGLREQAAKGSGRHFGDRCDRRARGRRGDLFPDSALHCRLYLRLQLAALADLRLQRRRRARPDRRDQAEQRGGHAHHSAKATR